MLATVAHAETLPNGLRVILEPDPTVNWIVVFVRYGGGYTIVIVGDAQKLRDPVSSFGLPVKTYEP